MATIMSVNVCDSKYNADPTGVRDLAQRLYEKNQQGRMTFMKNIGDALKEPAQSLAESAAKVPPVKRRTSCVYADLRKLHSEMELLKAA